MTTRGLKQQVDWSTRELPRSIRKLSEQDAHAYFKAFASMTEARPCPTASHNGREVDWPKAPLEIRAIPEGTMPLDEEEGYDHDKILSAFFSRNAPDGVVAWSIPATNQGAFKATYDSELVHWLRTELIASPLVIVSAAKDILLIANEQLRYTIVASSPEIVSDLEDEFDGPQAMRSTFADWVESNSLGFGDEDREWAKRYIVKWCDW